MHYIFGILLTFTSVFLILLILVQRGRGGGLSGALGGMGGQSAFGAKAGDTFTYVTIGVAAFWILMSIFAILVLSAGGGPLGRPSGALGGPDVPENSAPAGGATSLPPAGSGPAGSGTGEGAVPESPETTGASAGSTTSGTAQPAGAEAPADAGSSAAAQDGTSDVSE